MKSINKGDKMKNLKNKKGFTLIELLVVVTIMGLMGTVLISNYTKYVDKSKQVVVDQQLNEIVKTLEVAFMEGSQYNGIVLVGFEELEKEKLDVKIVYQSLVGKALPEDSTLTLSGGKLKYTSNSKTATYAY